jgi:hypothetical protein
LLNLKILNIITSILRYMQKILIYAALVLMASTTSSKTTTEKADAEMGGGGKLDDTSLVKQKQPTIIINNKRSRSRSRIIVKTKIKIKMNKTTNTNKKRGGAGKIMVRRKNNHGNKKNTNTTTTTTTTARNSSLTTSINSRKGHSFRNGSAFAQSGLLPKSNTAASSFGLPSFQHRTNYDDEEEENDDDDENDDDYDNDEQHQHQHQQVDTEIPSDTLMSINSLIQGSRGLHIPITNGGSIQAVLESQIYTIFNDDHSSCVNTELLELIRNNKVRRIYCQGNISTSSTSTAYIVTEDYVKAIWDAYYQSQQYDVANNTAAAPTTTTTIAIKSDEIITWFISNLHFWTNVTISESDLQDKWENNNYNNNNSNINSNKHDKSSIFVDADAGDDDNNIDYSNCSIHYVIKYLQESNYLIRDTNDNHNFCRGHQQEQYYYFWLPQWGVVLKGWNEARQQLLNFIARTGGAKKEVSKTNILQKNRHSYISTDFLLNELLHKERIRIIERPFGSFVQLVKDTT